MYSKRLVGYGLLFWMLEEVYMEICYVLLGLSRKCGIYLLLVVLMFVELKFMIEKFGKVYYVIFSEGNKVEFVYEKGVFICMFKIES